MRGFVYENGGAHSIARGADLLIPLKDILF